jgi:exonuclease III
MKIISWNCNGAFRNKFQNIIGKDADIYIIQECENPAISKNNEYKTWARNHLWIGDNVNKGLGIFANEKIKLNRFEWSNTYKDHSVKYFLPCIVNNDYQLLAVWAHSNNSPNFGYIGQMWKYIQINKNKFEKILIAGDFNSNSIWDEWDRWWNHSDVVKELKEQSIRSLYHEFYNEEQGKESISTFYLQKKIEKPYHIDYFFASKNLVNNVREFIVEDFINWKTISDHVPIMLKFDTI